MVRVTEYGNEEPTRRGRFGESAACPRNSRQRAAHGQKYVISLHFTHE
jgi:hypothetical protein